jgi:FkbM family methyltransferase
VNYSQGDEQPHIVAALGGVRPGRFLDIGAFHATQLSNTRALYLLGWSGVMVEPSPEPFLGLLREYGNDPRIQLICGAVGTERTIAKFHATADALTTSSEESYARWREAGGFYGSFYAPVIPLEELLHQFGDFDFVSIDTEGTSVALFYALLSTAMRPRCICVEHDGQADECRSRAAAAGYRELYFSGENLVFAQ